MFEVTVRPHLRGGWSRGTAWWTQFRAAVRPHAVKGLRALMAAVIALRGLAGLVLISYGAWLAYRPAGFIVAGVLLLVDRVMDERGEQGPR